MSKIATYSLADSPLQLSDRLIGTEAPRPIPSSTPLATKNFSLGELLQLFSSNFPAATLQAVLDAGNIATQDITLTGTIYVDLIKPTNIEDMLGSQGTPFQVLSKAIGGFNWVDPPGSITLTTVGSSGPSTLISGVLNIPVYTGGIGTTPTLQQVTDEGNVTSNDIIVRYALGNQISFTSVAGGSYVDAIFGTSIFQSGVQAGESIVLMSDDKGFATIYSNTASFSDLGSGGNVLIDSRESAIFLGNLGYVSFAGINGGLAKIKSDLITSATDLDQQLPNKSGTFAFLDDIPAPPTIPTKTSDLINDGEDGINPFITLADIPASTGIQHATASGTDTYTATIAGVTSYSDADAYLIRFTNGNTTGATLNINSLGAIPLYRNNDGPLLGGDVGSGGEMLCVYNSTTNVFQCIGTSPNSLFAYVTNDDSVTITKGMPVYAFSGTGDRMTVKRANNTGDSTSAQTVGLVLSASIAPNQKGFILMQGLLDGLNILPTATWSDGDAVYLGATNGSITNIKPYAPNHLVYLGTVTTASNGSAGRLYVRVQNGYELQELHNVQAQSPSLNDTLWYDSGVSPGQWKTASISSILGYTPVTNARTISTTSPLQGGGDLTANRTLSILQSSSSQSGFLSSADWISFNNRKKKVISDTTSAAITGTTSLSLAKTYEITVGTLPASGFLDAFIFATRTGTSAAYTAGLYINTTNNFATATLVSSISTNGNFNPVLPYVMKFALKDNLIVGGINNATTSTNFVNSATQTSVACNNSAASVWFFIGITLTNAGSTVNFQAIEMTT